MFSQAQYMVAGQFSAHPFTGEGLLAVNLLSSSAKIMQHCQINLSHFVWKIQQMDIGKHELNNLE